ncbi:CBS domain-containing protein [Streptomyces sp. NPDC059582]|uniref:CBS domain-containing protein n=1 Tax=Streptomyces sp. NPDC059582 TaxID=3346875 RepID=UPI003699CCAC
MTRAWTVRGGRFGQREETALNEDLVIAGWEETTADFSAYQTAEQFRETLRGFYPTEGVHTINNWAHQLWRFCKIIETGDLVVMPRKYQSVVSIGRILGAYEYRSDSPPGYRHVRPVKWLNVDVARAAVAGDLRDSMGSLLTISELSRRNAVERVEALAATGSDPGYAGYIQPPADPATLKQEVDEAGTRQLTARDLIGLWGWSRRTADAIEDVEHALRTLGLSVEPHFTAGHLNSLVTVSALDTAEPIQGVAGPEAHEESGAPAVSAQDDSPTKDFTWRIGNLPLATDVVSVTLEESLGRAVMHMVENDFSQLPVVDQHRRLVGVVTWESIARAKLGRTQDTIADARALQYPPTAREEEELFARIRDIQRHGFVIVVDAENVVTGILTAVDLAGELQARIQPFTVLEEVERRLRRAVSCLSVDELRSCFKDKSKAQKIHSAKDLTLGNYRFLVNDEQRWTKLAWPYDRADIVERLEAVAWYRNQLAHWDVDAPEQDSKQLEQAKQLLKLLKLVDRDPTE